MNKINKETRQNIFDIFIISQITWQGSLDDVSFLERLFNLSEIPSSDPRHKDAAGDISRHRIMNPGDWDDNWIFRDQRFDLLNCEDDIFLKFLCVTIHPVVRDGLDVVVKLKKQFNTFLKDCGYEIYEEGKLLNKPLFNFRIISNVSGLKIYVISSNAMAPPPPPFGTYYPCLFLIFDNWNDFGQLTTFNAFYYRDSSRRTELGIIKILQKNKTTTVIENGVQKLSDDYISLGQSLEFYETLVKLPRKEYEIILNVLNDVVYDRNKLTDEFLQNTGWQSSLLRNSEAEKALNEAGELFEKEYTNFESGTKFKFVTKVNGFDGEHKINFDFEKSDLPHRINILIGKNGTGKTKVLANIANAISGFVADKESYGNFTPKPNFSKIIAISYSVFDNFKIPANQSVFSYLFLGIRVSEESAGSEGLERLLTRKELEERFVGALEKIISNNKIKILEEIIGELFEINNFEVKNLREFFNKTSSGEAILLNIFTNVIANINKQSLLLIDEPEVHLHPNAISNFTRMLDKILIQFDSYAIISTHSPIIIQEIPSKYIRILKKEGAVPIVYNLNIESFGENLSTITNEIFETDCAATNYKDILDSLSINFTKEQIISLFDKSLSFNGKLYLESIFDLKNEKS